MNIRDYPTVLKRREALEKKLSVSLDHIGSFSLDEKTASTRHCENMIGVAQVPMGIAGPLTFFTSQGRQVTHYLPLATTEAALVASVSRGCKAITASGGATTDSHKAGATRGPVFKVKNLAENKKLQGYLEVNMSRLKQVAEQTSHHLTLAHVSSQGVGRYRYVRFVYDTQDAMGLNMVTIATDAICKIIEEETGAECIALSGNFCVDKKPSWKNFIENRGIKVWAEVVLTEAVLRDVLKTDAKRVYETWLSKCMMGSAMSGSMGFNAQYANIIAALFIATGQDPAHIVEGSIGITTAEVLNETDLYMSIYLPDLMVGTVGGGTGLATQKEALGILGITGGTNGKGALYLAEIIGAAVLAGEISLLSSLEQRTRASAYSKLARGKII